MDRNGFSDPYMTLSIMHEGREQRRQTKSIKKTLDPQWDELHEFAPVTSSDAV